MYATSFTWRYSKIQNHAQNTEDGVLDTGNTLVVPAITQSKTMGGNLALFVMDTQYDRERTQGS